MRQKFFLCLAGFIVLLFAGCAQPESQTGYIGAETAKQTALEAASLTADEVSFISTDMSTRDGLDYYQVCFEADGWRYQYDVDALTGVVIKAQGPDAVEEDRPNQSEEPGAQEPAGTPPALPAGSRPPAEEKPSAQAPEPSAAYIGEDEAKRIALEHAGMDAAQATFIRSELDFDDGVWVYDVEFYSAGQEEYDYEIDARTGAVISCGYDVRYDPRQQGGNGAITAEQARQLVLNRVPGASDGDIREFETDYDDGALQYEGELIYDGIKYEFEIDGFSGVVREWSEERLP